MIDVSTQKRGEDIYAYTRILKYRNKRYGTSVKDLFILVIVFFATGALDLYLNNNSAGNLKPVLFLIYVAFLFFLLLSFLDFSTGLGMFSGRGVSTSAITIGIAVIIVGIFSFLADDVFIGNFQPDVMALILLLNLLISCFGISYFVMTSVPNRQGQEQIIQNLSEIKEEITKMSIGELGVKNAIDRSVKWLQFQQTPERIWGETEPLYETAEITRVFFDLGKKLGYSWKDVRGGEEDLHKLEQTYYLLVENLETSNLDPAITTLSALTTIAMVNPDNLSVEVLQGESVSKIGFKTALKDLFLEFEEELKRQSEWDFVSELEKLDESFSNRMLLPTIFYFSRIFHFIDNKELFGRCAEILAETFGILIKRSDARFSTIEQKEISNYVLGLMYNTLAAILRKPKIVGEEIDTIFQEQSEEVLPGDLPGSGGFALPSLEDFDESDISLPSMDVDEEPTKLNINISMASARNLIRRKQEIDGSWSGRIDSTAECLMAVLDRESAESDFIKVGAHYLLALQEKNGSWQNDALLTAQVVRALHKIQSSVGGF